MSPNDLMQLFIFLAVVYVTVNVLFAMLLSRDGEVLRGLMLGLFLGPVGVIVVAILSTRREG